MDGARLGSYVVGEPRCGTVVVVPGLCVASYLRPACDAFAALGYRAWLVEPPGWPRSGPPPREPRTARDLARYVTAWLVAHDLRDVLLVGQSFGAQLAAHVATEAPERVRTLVLQGPVFDPAYRTMPRALGRWLSDLPRERPSLAVREVPEWLRVGPRRISRVLRLSLADELERTMREVARPVLVVRGQHDPLGSTPWAAGLAAPHGRFVLVPSVPHSYAHARPAQFAALVHQHSGAGSVADGH